MTHEYSAKAQWASIVSANFNFVRAPSLWLKSSSSTSRDRTGRLDVRDVKAHISVAIIVRHQMSNAQTNHEERYARRRVAGYKSARQFSVLQFFLSRFLVYPIYIQTIQDKQYKTCFISVQRSIEDFTKVISIHF